MKLAALPDEELITEAERLLEASGVSDRAAAYKELLKRFKEKVIDAKTEEGRS